MTLLTRAMVVTGAAVIVLVAGVHEASRTLVLRQFEALQRRGLHRNVERALAGLEDTLDDVRASTGDLAMSEEASRLLGGVDPGPPPESLGGASLDGLRVDVLAVCRHDGTPVWSRSRHGGVDRAMAAALGAADPSLRLPPGWTGPVPAWRGVRATPAGPYLAVCVPVVGAAAGGGLGASEGVVVAGVRLDERQARRLSSLVAMGVEFLPAGARGSPLSPDGPGDFEPLATPSASAWVRAEGGRTDGAHVLLESGGAPAAWMRVCVPREIVRHGEVMAGYVELTLVGAGTAFAALFLVALNRWVLRRVRRLAADVDRVAMRGDPNARVGATGTDEIAGLARRINGMLDAIRAQELKLERWAGEVDDARVAAVAANRAKSEFLANMSHEIRTPMTAILGFADLVMEPDGSPAPPATQLDAVRTIQRNGEHLLGVINDILDISKIEAGKMRVESIPCAPAALVEDVRQLMALRAQAAGLDLRVETAFPLPAAIASDPVRVRQVLVNLVGNAIKFTPPPPGGAGRIVVRLGADGPDAPGGPRLRISCADSGIGVTPEVAARLFTAFTQADASHTRRYGGTGLGLAICKRLAAMLGGDLVHRAPEGGGAGAVFELTLPVAPPPGEARVRWISSPAELGGAPAPCEPAPPPAGGDAPLACRVLLAEDGPDNQRLISHVLRKAGASVEVVENGRLAVERVGAAPRGFDLVILDMQMPEMDGYAAAAALRELGFAGPVLALTAHAMAGDREKCLGAGCSDFLTKPIDRHRLVERCRHWTRAAGERAVTRAA